MGNRPDFFSVARAVGQVTFRELLGDKILYNSAVGCFLLLGLGSLAARLSFVHPERIILDFGLSALNLSCSAIAILMGSSLMVKEFERRTVHLVMAHPISWFQFVWGKLLGIGVVLTLNWLIFSFGYLVVLWGASPTQGLIFTEALGVALILIWVQTLVLASLAILFSSVSTASLSVMITVGFCLIGNNISQIQFVAARSQFMPTRGFLSLLAAVLPNLEHFSLGTQVTYGLSIPGSFVFQAFLYGFTWVCFFLIAAGLLIQKREL